MTKFAIVAQARSGSTMVGTAIARHPQVLMHGEIFGAPHFPLNFYGIDENLPWPTPLEIYLKGMRDSDPELFLENMVFADTGRCAIGLKFKFEEFAIWPAVKQFIRERALRIIFIRRQSLLNRYLSEVEALLKGRFNSTDKTSYGPIDEVDIRNKLSFSAIRDVIDESIGYEKEFRSFFGQNRVLELTYEKTIDNWNNTASAICEFLGIVEMSIDPETVRQPCLQNIDAYFDRIRLRRELIEAGYSDFI